MKYYLHDSNAFNDEKVTKLFIAFGYEGLGLFYTILEKLAQQEKPVNTAVLKAQLGIGKRLAKCWSFMEEIGIICSNNGDTFNKQLLKFNEMYQEKKEKNRKKCEDFRVKHEKVTGSEPVRNQPNSIVVNSMVCNSITPIQPVQVLPEFNFDEIWKQYPNKDGRKQAQRHFNASVKTEADFADIQTALFNYLNSKAVRGGFVKNGSTWFNNWRDWIINPVATEEPGSRLKAAIEAKEQQRITGGENV